MHRCDASVGLSKDGHLHINFTGCKPAETVEGNATSRTKLKDDANGAMQYTVAVCVVYSIAVIGVFLLGVYNRRKYRRDHNDIETSAFLKNYDDIRRICEQRSRVGAINALLHQLHKEPDADRSFSQSRPSTHSLAFLPISLSNMHDNSDLNIGLDSTLEMSVFNHAPISGGGLPSNLCDKDRQPSNVPGRAKQTMLGSSRRSYKGCRRCWSKRGLTLSRDKCLCSVAHILDGDIPINDSDDLIEVVTNNERLENETNNSEDDNNIRFL